MDFTDTYLPNGKREIECSETLSKKLSKDGLKCVPEGVHHIEEIYSLVKAEYPEL